MKKILAIILAVVLCLSLGACAGNGEKSIEDKVKDAVKSQVEGNVLLRYGTYPEGVSCYVTEVSGNRFEVTGRITVKDKYYNLHAGTYEATVEYDSSTDTCDVYCDIGKIV